MKRFISSSPILLSVIITCILICDFADTLSDDSQTNGELHLRLRVGDPSASDGQASADNTSVTPPLNQTSRPKSEEKPKRLNPTVKVQLNKPKPLAPPPRDRYDARGVAFFLESHPALSIYDPRAYFTEERTSRSMAIMLNEIKRLPSKMRFAYMARVFDELGRKIASKLNYYSSEVVSILRKKPDALGNKPEVTMLLDVIKNAFESKEDPDVSLLNREPISSLIDKDIEKEVIFESSLDQIGTRFAHIISYFAVTVSKTSLNITKRMREPMANVLCDALMKGANKFTRGISKIDKFRVQLEVKGYMERILDISTAILRRNILDNDNRVGTYSMKYFQQSSMLSFEDLNSMSIATGSEAPWHSYLFANLGSSERVVKLFTALLKRVPTEAKSHWIKKHIDQVHSEVEKTLSGFVLMQSMPKNDASSEVLLLDTKQLAPLRGDYSAEKNRVPGRCYLAGRRWRLLLSKAMKGHPSKDIIIKSMADKIGEFKSKLVSQSGNDIYRLCLPRLEVGIRGWGINGEPSADGGQSSKFTIKNPIEGLSSMADPFVSGVKMGYKIGFKVGYNEERNATLELERVGGYNKGLADRNKAEISFIARASYRRGATEAAKKAFDIAVRDGYLTTLKVSVRSGILIPSEAASRMAALKGFSFASQAGAQAGRAVADSYVASNDINDNFRNKLTKLGEAYGLLAGGIMGDVIGAVVGKEAAEEAYRRGITRGGKLTHAKFHLEKYAEGAKLGFDHGLKEGKRVASSSSLDPAAPKLLKLMKPVFSDVDKSDHDHEVDHWEKDLMPTLTTKVINQLQLMRNHTIIRGTLVGNYRVAKEVKKGFERVSFTNTTYKLKVFADGFIKDDIAYLTLNGRVNGVPALRGSLIARDLFDEDKGS